MENRTALSLSLDIEVLRRNHPARSQRRAVPPRSVLTVLRYCVEWRNGVDGHRRPFASCLWDLAALCGGIRKPN